MAQQNSNSDWASPSLKEEPFWHDGMTVEEFENERDYYLKNWDKWKTTQYVPLWKQKQQVCDAK